MKYNKFIFYTFTILGLDKKLYNIKGKALGLEIARALILNLVAMQGFEPRTLRI
jgi:hypothetical protein